MKFETITLAIDLTVAVALVGELIIVPAIEHADAKNAVSESQNKRQQGALKGKRRSQSMNLKQ